MSKPKDKVNFWVNGLTTVHDKQQSWRGGGWNDLGKEVPNGETLSFSPWGHLLISEKITPQLP